jgi:two-component system response regulator FixJ
MPSKIVFLVDDDAAMRDSVSFLLLTAGYAVETFDTPGALLSAAARLSEGCIISDVRMPEMSGLQLLRRLKEIGVRLPVIMITGHADVSIAVEAMKAGAADFIEKPFSDDVILAAIEVAMARPADQQGDVRQKTEIVTRVASLTDREQQVLRRVVAGESNKVVAQNLGISHRTVDIYRANVMTKMRAGSLSELVRMAILAGIG